MKKITEQIPGGWFGNDPGSFEKLPKSGNVTCDIRKAKQAIQWLQKRARILATSAYIGLNDCHGIIFDYELK